MKEEVAERPLRFLAEGYVIVEVDVVEPSFHIRTGLADVAHAFGEKLQCFGVAVGTAHRQQCSNPSFSLLYL